MKSKTFLLLLCFAMILIFPSIVYGFGPSLHIDLGNRAINEMPSSNLIKQTINLNQDTKDMCSLGMNFPDVSVIYYYTNFETYRSVHDWNLYQKLIELSETPEEKAFSYCYGLHLAADTISHNYHVPDKIRHYRILPNAIIHPSTEILLEVNHYNPAMLGSFSRWPDAIPLMKKASGRDWSKEAKILEQAISGGSFYSTAYAPPSASFVGKFYPWLAKVLQKFLDPDSSIPYQTLVVQQSKEILSGAPQLPLAPDGELALKQADASISLWRYAVLFIFFILAVLLLKWRKII